MVIGLLSHLLSPELNPTMPDTPISESESQTHHYDDSLSYRAVVEAQSNLQVAIGLNRGPERVDAAINALEQANAEWSARATPRHIELMTWLDKLARAWPDTDGKCSEEIDLFLGNCYMEDAGDDEEVAELCYRNFLKMGRKNSDEVVTTILKVAAGKKGSAENLALLITCYASIRDVRETARALATHPEEWLTHPDGLLFLALEEVVRECKGQELRDTVQIWVEYAPHTLGNYLQESANSPEEQSNIERIRSVFRTQDDLLPMLNSPDRTVRQTAMQWVAQLPSAKPKLTRVKKKTL
jgi:hypothetical protein